MASVIVTSRKQKGEYLPLGQRTSVIGRDEALSLRVLDALVSRKHLRVWFDKATNKYYADDMQSKHGVSINGHKITDSILLTNGDEIMIGDAALLYTDKDLDSRESVLSHYKKRGESTYRTRGNSYMCPPKIEKIAKTSLKRKESYNGKKETRQGFMVEERDCFTQKTLFK